MNKIVVTVLAIIVCVKLQAQENKVELTLEQAIEIALNENPTVKVADMEIQKQKYARKETVGNHLPSLSINGQYMHAMVKQEVAPGLSFSADNMINANASLSIPLVIPAVYAALKMNRTQMESAVESARSSKINLVNEVRKAYYTVLLAENSLNVFLETQKTVTEVFNNTKAMCHSGLASEYDLITAEVQLNNLNPTIIQLKNGVALSKLMLKMLLGLPETVEVAPTTTLESYSDKALTDCRSYSSDISMNSDLRTLHLQRQMLQDQVRIINSQRLPMLSAFGSGVLAGDDLNFALPGMPPAGSGFKWQNPVNVGVQLSIPLFSGLKNVNKIRQTKTTISQLELQTRYAEQGLKIQLERAISNISAAKESIDANYKTVVLAEKAYKIAVARQETGMGTMLELNSAQLSLTQAKLSYSQSIHDYLAAEADYEKIMGIEYVLK